jgi:hypothetical protein
VSTIGSIQDGLAVNLATIQGLRTSSFVPDNPSPPIAIPMPKGIEYDKAFGHGLHLYRYDVIVIAVRASERIAQSVLDAYCDPSGASSVKAAIESDRTLGGIAQTLHVGQRTDIKALQISETTYLAAYFDVQVYA